MTSEEKKIFLKSYGCAKKAIERYQEEMKEIEEMESNRPEFMSSEAKRQENELLRSLKNDLIERKRKKEEVCHSVVKCIEEMPEGTEQECLKLRYIMGLTWKQIADKMMYSVVHVHRIHNKALEQFN